MVKPKEKQKASGKQLVKVKKEVMQTLDIGRSIDIVAFSKELSRFVLQQKLAVNIAGKQYIMVEGWQFAGVRMGIFPMPEDPVRIPTDDKSEIKYECKVNLFRLGTGETIGHGYGLCSNKEGKKRMFEEYAIASMAQTRAIGKAYRNLLSWLVKAAGFEPTPYEEIDADFVVSNGKNGNGTLKSKEKIDRVLGESLSKAPAQPTDKDLKDNADAEKKKAENNVLARIHILKEEKKVSESDYQGYILEISEGKCVSSACLNVVGRDKLVALLDALETPALKDLRAVAVKPEEKKTEEENEFPAFDDGKVRLQIIIQYVTESAAPIESLMVLKLFGIAENWVAESNPVSVGDLISLKPSAKAYFKGVILPRVAKDKLYNAALKSALGIKEGR